MVGNERLVREDAGQVPLGIILLRDVHLQRIVRGDPNRQCVITRAIASRLQRADCDKVGIVVSEVVRVDYAYVAGVQRPCEHLVLALSATWRECELQRDDDRLQLKT